MKKYIADIVTGLRILGSIVLLFVPVFSVLFYVVYIICGLSDMTDGTIARKTGSSSPFGAVLDTIADLSFAAVSLVKVLPRLSVPVWLWGWIAVIAFIKVANIVTGFILSKRFVSVHSVMNKVSGLLLFLLPLTLNFIELKYSAVIVCSAATVSAVQEGYFVCTRRAFAFGQDRKDENDD